MSAPSPGGPAGAGPAPSPTWGGIPRRLSLALYVAIPLVTVGAAASTGNLSGAKVASYLPVASVDVLYSFLRMSAAYGLSLAFALAYG
jgi:hypothetical protein